jgi:hypothetical protein
MAKALILLLASCLLVTAACSFNTLGGREKCWPESDARVASLWRGVVRIDASGAWLDTPEGEAIPLVAGTLQPRVADDGSGQLVRGEDVVARAGDDVTLFGGAGSDGALVVCAVEEVHSTTSG